MVKACLKLMLMDFSFVCDGKTFLIESNVNKKRNEEAKGHLTFLTLLDSC